MRLIDAKETEKQVKEAFKENPFAMGMLLRWIRKQPTIDAVEVLRCKDCKHRDAIFVCAQFDAEVGANHFCALGERRSDG